MSETTNPASAETSFAELFQSTTEAVKEGEIAQGKVLAIDDDYVTVDVGFKSEGQVQTWEFMDDDGTIQIAVGDTVEVLVEDAEDEDGRVVLSKEKAERLKVWEDISLISSYSPMNPTVNEVRQQRKE